MYHLNLWLNGAIFVETEDAANLIGRRLHAGCPLADRETRRFQSLGPQIVGFVATPSDLNANYLVVLQDITHKYSHIRLDRIPDTVRQAMVYPVLWVDALYEKVRVDGRIVSMAVLIVCGVDENGHRDIIAVEPMAEESRRSYGVLF